MQQGEMDGSAQSAARAHDLSTGALRVPRSTHTLAVACTDPDESRGDVILPQDLVPALWGRMRDTYWQPSVQAGDWVPPCRGMNPGWWHSGRAPASSHAAPAASVTKAGAATPGSHTTTPACLILWQVGTHSPVTHSGHADAVFTPLSSNYC